MMRNFKTPGVRHYKFNSLFHKQHLNMRNNTDERLRRSLADISLIKVQPVAIDEI